MGLIFQKKGRIRYFYPFQIFRHGAIPKPPLYLSFIRITDNSNNLRKVNVLFCPGELLIQSVISSEK